MSETPDPQTAREIARELILNHAKNLAQDDDAVFESVIERAGCISPGLSEQEALADDVLAEIGNATVTVSWPDEQTRDATPLGAAELAELTASINHLSGPDAWDSDRLEPALIPVTQHVPRLLAELKARQPQHERDEDTRAIDAMIMASIRGDSGAMALAFGKVRKRWIGRIAELDAREPKAEH